MRVVVVISYERIVSINHLSKEILEHVMKYLSSDQLRQSCLRVNKQWNLCATKGSCPLLLWREGNVLVRTVLQGRSPICSIPDEILLRLFTFYVNPSDLFRSCVRVNKRWNQICQDRTIWKIVNPINWSKGIHRTPLDSPWSICLRRCVEFQCSRGRDVQFRRWISRERRSSPWNVHEWVRFRKQRKVTISMVLSNVSYRRMAMPLKIWFSRRV